MNVLAINGSPRGERSNTFKLCKAFLAGIARAGNHGIEIVDVSKSRIEPCRGCFRCWGETPGKCAIEDDMSNGIFAKCINADMVIWSFPLYFFGMPSKAKALLDRLLPNTMPDIIPDGKGGVKHPTRHDTSTQRHALISTCGFPAIEKNYDGLIAQFDILFGDRLTMLLCPEGELFRAPQMENRTNEYLSYVAEAGKEYASLGRISGELREKLDEPLLPAKEFLEMANRRKTP